MKSNAARCPVNVFLFSASVIIFLFLVIHSVGLYPVVMTDEYFSSLFSRLLPLSDIARRPGYIYSLIYRVTNTCGDGFLDGARILNAMFFVAAMPFIYAIAKRVCTKKVAAIVTLMALLGLINSYTVYFMPESLYFLSFWIFTWFMLRQDNRSAARSWCLGGGLLGLWSLIKPHALFLLPSMVLYILFFNRKKEGTWMFRAFGNAVLFVACAFLTKFLIGYALAGKAGITILGTEYTTIASTAPITFQRCLELLVVFTENIKGHVLAICLLFGMPMAIALIAVFNTINNKEEVRADQKVSFYTLAVLSNLVLVTGLFTALVGNAGPYESVARLHMRYYNFAFPLLLVIAASPLSLTSIDSKRRWRMMAASLIGAAILCAIYTRMAPFTPSLVDNPELRGFIANSTVFYILGGLSFFALIVWGCVARFGARLFTYLVMPLIIIFSSFYVNKDLRQRLVPDVFDKAGIFAKQYLPERALPEVMVVGSDPAGLFRSLFHLDNPSAELQMIQEGEDYDLSALPPGKKWVLVVGDHSLIGAPFFQLPLNGFTLACAMDMGTIDFRRTTWPGGVARTSGLFGAEPWGTWSDGDTVTLEFVMPLPERFTVYLIASAFGPNVGKEFVARVGESTNRFVLNGVPEERALVFNNPEKLRTMTITIPLPASPKELGMSLDERRLGMGFVELRIVPLHCHPTSPFFRA